MYKADLYKEQNISQIPAIEVLKKPRLYRHSSRGNRGYKGGKFI